MIPEFIRANLPEATFLVLVAILLIQIFICFNLPFLSVYRRLLSAASQILIQLDNMATTINRVAEILDESNRNIDEINRRLKAQEPKETFDEWIDKVRDENP